MEMLVELREQTSSKKCFRWCDIELLLALPVGRSENEPRPYRGIAPMLARSIGIVECDTPLVRNSERFVYTRGSRSIDRLACVINTCCCWQSHSICPIIVCSVQVQVLLFTRTYFHLRNWGLSRVMECLRARANFRLPSPKSTSTMAASGPPISA